MKTLGQFLAREVPRRTVLGLDYYEWNERLVDRDGRRARSVSCSAGM